MTEHLLIWVTILAAGAFSAAVLMGWLVIQRSTQIKQQLSENRSLESAHTKLFSFMHQMSSLAEVESRASTQLYRFITERAIEVLDADGGAIYAIDKTQKELVPRHISDTWACMVELTDEQQQSIAGGGIKLLSILRLLSVPLQQSFLGQLFQKGEIQFLKSLDEQAQLCSTQAQRTSGSSAWVGVLTSGRMKLGLLVLTFKSAQHVRKVYEMNIFKTLTEQAAFTIRNALLNEEARRGRLAEQDIENAGEAQRVLMPDSDPVLDGFVICGKNQAARLLSGDFYDYVWPDENHFGAVIADVSGKGFPAALVAASVRSALKAHALGKLSPTEALRAVNRQVYDDIREDMFVTISYLIVHQGQPHVTLCRAGHTPPLLWRAATGQVELLEAKGISVGFDRGPLFDRRTADFAFTMQLGDCLLLYTDGVNEATRDEDEEFGEERITTVLKTAGPLGAKAVVQQMQDAVKQFMGDRPSSDDITIMVLQKT
jgi:sigma-B regulation protein RsbU (phosphoserine phosphatase)